MTALEIELLRTKQELGEALNAVYEYEQTAADRELSNPMAFGSGTMRGNDSGNSSDQTIESQRNKNDDADGGSGSTKIKK